MSVREFMDELSLFSELTDQEINLLDPVCHVVEGRSGDCIIREGEPVEQLYILITGEASVIKDRSDGKQATIGTVGQDDVLGEMSFFKHTPATVTIESKTAYKALAIDQSQLQRFLEGHPTIGYKVMKKLNRVTSRRLKVMVGFIADHMSAKEEVYHSGRK